MSLTLFSVDEFKYEHKKKQYQHNVFIYNDLILILIKVFWDCCSLILKLRYCGLELSNSLKLLHRKIVIHPNMGAL